MPVFEVEKGGKTYEIDAPSMDAAMGAFRSFSPPESVAPKAPPKPEVSTGKDVLRQALTGPVAGGVDFLSTLGQAVSQPFRAAGREIGARLSGQDPFEAWKQQGKPPSTEPIKEALGIPKAQTTAGKYVGAAMSALGNPTTYMGGMGLARNVVGGLASGLGAQAGGDVGEKYGGRAGGIVGSVLGGAVAGAGAGRALSPSAKPVAPVNVAKTPELHELESAYTKAYDELKTKRVPITPHTDPQTGVITHEATQLGESIEADLAQEQFFKEDQPKTFRHLKRLGNPDIKDTGEVYAVRTALSHIVNDEKNPLTGRLSSDGAAAKMAMERIDRYIETKPELADIAQVARINYRAAETAKELEAQTGEAITRGKTSGFGANVDASIRRQMAQFVKNKYLTTEERALARQIAEGNSTTNIARSLKKFRPTEPIRGLAVAVDFAGGHGAASALTALVDIFARRVAKKSAEAQVEHLSEQIRRSVLPQAQGPAHQPLRLTVHPAAAGAAKGAFQGQQNRLYDE